VTSRNFGVNTEAPKIQASTYRLNPTTGAVNIVDDTLIFPNGISFSPDGKTLYMSDTAGGVGNTDPRITAAQAGGLTYNSTNPRTIYAFDVTSDSAHLTGRRPLYTAMEYVPDGLKVASNGYLVTGAGFGVDILDTAGIPILRIQTPFISVNTAFAGINLDELWIVGHGAVARVKINLSGIAL
jgi:sugar lactone lactonase YvrE